MSNPPSAIAAAGAPTAATQARWAGLCRSCVTVDETARMQRDIAEDVAMRIRSAA
jgi:hypothetical protein